MHNIDLPINMVRRDLIGQDDDAIVSLFFVLAPDSTPDDLASASVPDALALSPPSP